MIASTPQSAQRIGAVIIADDQRGPRGLPSRWHDDLDDRIVLRHTVDRLRQTDLDDVIVVCPTGAAVAFEDVTNLQTSLPLTDAVHDRAVAARKWSPNCWRGGIGGATVYDELIVAAPMLEAMKVHRLDAVLVVGPDWPRLDPQLCDAVIARYRENPESNPLTFTQAPPGLCGIVIGRELLGRMQADGAMFGAMIDYNPRAPQADPIAKNVCVQIEPAIRQQMRRFTYDAQRWVEALNREGRRGEKAQREELSSDSAPSRLCEYQQMVIELTPQRPATGPITPQHHVAIERLPMPVDDAKRILDRVAEVDDIAVTFGGLGDALCHPHWVELIEYARTAGVYGIHLETDLHVDQPALERLAELPIDVLSVRLNADSPETYARLMGGDDLHAVMKRIEWLLKHRQSGGLQWVVPRMIKTNDNVHELESFVDRWTYFAGHAVVERPPMPEQAVIDMSAGYKLADGWKRDVLHVLSNGMVVEENDWQGDRPICRMSELGCGM
jgi:hypothetical protein